MKLSRYFFKDIAKEFSMTYVEDKDFLSFDRKGNTGR
jgi:hypothetical protein